MKFYLVSTPNFYVEAENEEEAEQQAIKMIKDESIFLDITNAD